MSEMEKKAKVKVKGEGQGQEKIRMVSMCFYFDEKSNQHQEIQIPINAFYEALKKNCAPCTLPRLSDVQCITSRFFKD